MLGIGMVAEVALTAFAKKFGILFNYIEYKMPVFLLGIVYANSPMPLCIVLAGPHTNCNVAICLLYTLWVYRDLF